MWIPKTIYEHEAGLRYRKGKLVGVVGAGQYWYWSNTHEFVVIDMRPRAKIVGGQEVMARDGATLKVSMLLNYRVADAKLYRESGGGKSGRTEAYGWQEPSPVVEPDEHLHHATQILLREWAAPLSLQEALDARGDLAGAFAEPLGATAAGLGLAVDSVQLLDFGIAGNLRAAHADQLKAELEGQASLQRARNEAATMRSLLNTARLVREHPGLLELRVLTGGQKPRVHLTVTPREGQAAVPFVDEEA